MIVVQYVTRVSYCRLFKHYVMTQNIDFPRGNFALAEVSNSPPWPSPSCTTNFYHSARKLFPVEKTSHLMLSKQQHLTVKTPASLLTCPQTAMLRITVCLLAHGTWDWLTDWLKHCGQLRLISLDKHWQQSALEEFSGERERVSV